ncbi:PfkB family carbohydrate kinase [Photobacterium sp. ZSDE20]|uniref:PfkB family carbohydrate kinase n=1 Tax=Photobacterium pectinilyticum TaxID=2906793 RepID=A0ABT1MWL4_9GAMM|nr:PfkB family carbohydrate kinase [Photobacterium sp. ZSDE20]MCQ1056886.1 PfkB family carbohydrate kinase [Photobacterium sp. ZSDE20]MDD1821021.1 PfkB family carbohydrate kinase [Photobacterium sp. ZSDE20]
MANVMLVANLNCDRVLQLKESLQAGGRHHYQDLGRRLGGGGANTGLALVYAGHQVTLVSQVGRDETADWLLAEASLKGLNCSLLQRNDITTPELMLLMTPDGERTIIRPERPAFSLGPAPDFTRWDGIYINSSAQGVEQWSTAALEQNDAILVVAQLPKSHSQRPCQVLITSQSDLDAHIASSERATGINDIPPFQYAKSIAGVSLEYFIVTDGENGATAYSDSEQESVPAVAADVVDTTGAGDAFAAGVISGLLAKLSISESMTVGAKWAAIAVATASSVPGDEFQAFLAQ